MTIASLMHGFNPPGILARQKALYATVALTFFCLPLGTAPSTIAGVLAVGIWLFSGIALDRRRLYAARYWWPVYVLIGLTWIGMIYTHDNTDLGMDYAEKTYYWLFGFSAAAVLFQRFSAKQLIKAFMLGLGLNVFAAIAQIVFRLPDKNNWHRGLGPDYSTLSAYLIVGMMMGLFFLRRERRTKAKMAIAGLVGLYFFHLVILQSRASYVAFVLLVPFIGFTFFKSRQLLKTMAICVLIPCLMMLSPIVRNRVALTVEQLSHHLTATDGTAWGSRHSTQQDRFYMWNGALQIIRDYPLIGVGTGGYRTALHARDSDPQAPYIAHPHNIFLHMTVSHGIVGLAALLWFLYVLMSNGWRHREHAQGYFLMCVALVTVTTGLFNTQILDVGTAMLLSLTVGLQQALPRGRSNG